MPGFLEMLQGTPARTENVPLFNQGQQNLQNQSIQQLLGLLQGTGGTEGFKPFEEQARTQFQQNTIPTLAERFTALGGGQRSSAFQGALGNAASGLEQSLAGLRSQYGQNQLRSLLPFAGQQSFQPVQHARVPGFGEQALSGLAGISGPLLALLGMYLGGPAGAAAGSAIGSSFAPKAQPQPMALGGNNLMNAFGQQPLNFGPSPSLNF